MKNNHYAFCEINTYSIEKFFLDLQKNNIYIYNMEKVNDYVYHFYCSKINYHKIKKLNYEIKILNHYGFIAIFDNLLKKKITLISLIISLLFFTYLNTKVFCIQIKGVSEEITLSLQESLKKEGIVKYCTKKPISKLKEIEKRLFIEYQNKIDLLSITSSGAFILVNYEKKKDEIILEERHGKMYAKKDGIIKLINISSGNVLVTENKYVKKDDLLVDDYIYYKEESTYVGTQGKIFANTFNLNQLKEKTNGRTKEQVFSDMLIKMRYEIAKTFEINDYIEKEQVIKYDYNQDYSLLVINFTLFENIVYF